ncbi:trafficking protein particle complex subunit 12-like [Argonauta hians]
MDQSVCLDDDDDDIISDIVNTAHLNIDQDPLTSALVHSPTTDTLDSVMLEPSPSEDGSEEPEGELAKSTSASPIPKDTSLQDVESEAHTVSAALAGGADVTPVTTEDPDEGNVNDPDMKGVTITITSATHEDLAPQGHQEEMTLDTAQSPTQVPAADNSTGDDAEVSAGGEADCTESVGGGGGGPIPPHPSISSYFAAPAVSPNNQAENFFDNIAAEPNGQAAATAATTAAAAAGLELGPESSAAAAAVPVASETPPPPPPLDSLSLENVDSVTEVALSQNPDIIPTSPRNFAQVHQEPESVTFEGTESVIEENCNVPEKADFLFDDEEFESFTAEESQIGFELGVTNSPKQVLTESYSHGSEHTSLERERHVSSSSSTTTIKTPQLSSEIVRETSTNQFFSELSPSLSEEPEVQSPAAAVNPPPPAVVPPKLVASVNTASSQAAPPPSSSHGTPVHQQSQVQTVSSSGVTTVPFQQFIEDVNTDDLFTMGLDMSDSDRRHDAWLAQPSTLKILSEVAAAQEKPVYPSEGLSTPGITVEEAQPDPIQEMLRKFMGDDEADLRQTMSVDSVSQDTDGLCKLVKNECFRAAVEMTGRLLTAAKQGPENIGHITQHTPHTLQIWFCRVALLLKLRLYSVAHSELQNFRNLDTPDLYYQFYPELYPGRKGSMVPFGLRLLDAQLPYYLGHNKDAVDKLYHILSVVQQVITNLENGLSEDGSAMELSTESKKASLELWCKRQSQVMYIIANILLSIKDYVAALEVYQELLKKDEVSECALLTGIGRIFLQMGDIGTAESYFKKSEDLSPGTKHDAAKIALNKGLVALCTSNFHEAFQYFKSAVLDDPSNPVAVNNMAVSSLYLGKLKDALDTLEDLVHSDPTHNLHEGILFNLCTLYELESSHAPQKKQSLLSLVSKHKGDSFHVACLKMS